MQFNKTFLVKVMRASSLCIAIAMQFSMPSEASIHKQMEQLFGSMTNITQAGVFETQRRGILAGGSAVIRHKIMDERLLTFVPPSAQAGCSGIDLYAGSLSYINADQFVQLLRTVAANAKGYAFQLALSAMCEKCSQQIETLQKKVQQLNEYFGQSCQLAQGLVNDTLSAFDRKGQSDASLINMVNGIGDVFDSFSQNSGRNAYEQIATMAPEIMTKTIQGNLVWRALKKQAVENWFIAGDEALLEAIMSVTGSLIIGKAQTQATDEGTSLEVMKLPPYQLTLSGLLLGGEVNIFECNDHHEDGCLKPQLTPINLEGLSQKVSRLLLGNSSEAGIIAKFASNQGGLNHVEMAFMTTAPAHIGTMIRTLSSMNEDAARSFAHRAAPFIALEMANRMITDMMKSVRETTSLESHGYEKLLQQQLNLVQEMINDEYQAMLIRFGSEQTMINHYHQLMQLLQPNRYLELDTYWGAR